MIHYPGPDCRGCNDKLMGVHLAMVAWFKWIKELHPEIHCCWGWRGEADQHADFLAGRSKVDWPYSKHNQTYNNMPCSHAIDIFTIDANGSAKFNPDFFEQIANETNAAGYKITWGGSFKRLKDYDHFELKDEPL